MSKTQESLAAAFAEENPAERSCQDRQTDQEPELRLVEPQIAFYPDADNGEDRPDRETDGESNRREPESPPLAGNRVRHTVPP